MPNLRNCTISQLAEVLGASKDQVVAEWLAQAKALFKKRHLDGPTLTDHVPDVIAEIIRDLALDRDGALSEEHTRGSPPAHGVQRFYDGLDAGEVVAEYNLLRAAFHAVAESHGFYVVGDGARIINRRIDEAVRMSVMAFAAQQSLIRKEKETEHLCFIAHDLRTPLNAVALIVGELKRDRNQLPESESAELFDILDRNLARVETLIRKVLETNSQASGTGSSFSPELRRFELWPLVQRLFYDLHAISSTRAIEVVNEIPRTLTIYADAGLIAQVFQNLLGNAFEYASNGRVVVSAKLDADGVTCMVKDNGKGIPLEMLARVFDKLATDPNKSGSGLGLTIVKQIVEAHGGSVNAESVYGAGATFTFTIPREKT